MTFEPGHEFQIESNVRDEEDEKDTRKFFLLLFLLQFVPHSTISRDIVELGEFTSGTWKELGNIGK